MTAQRVLDVARREIGYREGARNANKYGAAYGVNNVAWCMQFCWWVFREAGVGHLIHPKTAYTPTAYDWHRTRGQVSTTPRVGSLVFFDWPPASRIQHVGIVEAVEASAIVTIEGNTQSGSAGNQSDGGGVYRRRRARNSSIVGYGHPAYSGTPNPSVATVHPILRRGSTGEAVRAMQRALGIVADGDFGPATETAVRAFQASHRLVVDGIAGPTTLTALYATPDVQEDDDMPTPAQMWDHLITDFYVPAGQPHRMKPARELLGWAATHAATADGHARQVMEKVDDLTARVDALRPGATSGPAVLSDADVQRIASAVLAELSKRTAA